MLRLFRSLRRNVLSGQRSVKYLLYALGEILLVVVGILIALQINNWNDGKKNRRTEYITLVELQKTTVANGAELTRCLNAIDQHIQSINVILKAAEKEMPYYDSLSFHFSRATLYQGVFFNVGAYESMKFSGSQIIGDDKLRFALSDYYDFEWPVVELSLRDTRADFYHYMLDYIRTEFVDYSGSTQNIAIPRDYPALMRDQTFLSSLQAFRDIHILCVERLKKLINITEDLLQDIDTRLEEIKP
jgi:hypothetical protein